jgi:hypothetical protein
MSMGKWRWVLLILAVILSGVVCGGVVFLHYSSQERARAAELERLAESIDELRDRAYYLDLQTLKNHIGDFDDDDWRDVVPKVRSDVVILEQQIDVIKGDLESVDEDINRLLGREPGPRKPRSPKAPRPHRQPTR